jgi:RNA polymerase sigma-70 factor (ECF subfamily)
MAGPERGRLLRLVARQPRAAQPDALAGVAEAAVAGDRRAIRTFLATISPHLLRVVRRVLGAHHADVDDTAQEAAFAVIEALPSHRGECSLLHFACRIGVLTAMNVRRRDATKKRASLRAYDVEPETVANQDLAAPAAMAAAARARAVRELVDALAPAQAEVIALHIMLGYTVREIAESSGVPVETVRSRLRLAKQALRERISEDPLLAHLVKEPA